jgi:hypothetical protein
MELLQGKQEQHKFSEIKLFFLLFFKIDPQEETTRHHDTRVDSEAPAACIFTFNIMYNT